MKNYKIISIIIVLVLQINTIYSQNINISELKDWQLKGYAESAIRQNDTYSAIEFLEEYHSHCNYDTEADLKLANLYFETNNYKKAKVMYYDLYQKNNVKYLRQLYNYAIILKSEMQYEFAIVYFEKFKKEAEYHLKGKEKTLYLYLTAIQIEGCEYALENLKKEKSIYINHLNTTINKPHLETAPFIYNDTMLIYSSLASDTVPVINLGENYKAPQNQFYTAILINNEWQGGYEAPKPFYNFDTLHTANGVFSKDKKRFYFTSTHRNKLNENISHINVSVFEKGVWQEPYKLGNNINLKNYTSTQPAIGNCYVADYEIIYFISNRPKGKGGMDIWFTVYDKKNKKYKKPVNAGGFINTISDEMTPYYCNEDTILYYSSNGLPGFGGFDIYKAKGWGANWDKAENMGFPVNSSFNDLYYNPSPNKQNGFLVSNRDGSIELNSPNCCYDIFEFAIIKETPDDSLYANIDTLRNITDTLIIAQTNLTTETTNDINIELENYVTSTIQKNSESSVFTPKEKSVVFNNIYFDYNSANLKPESKILLDNTIFPIMQKYQNITVEIGAHTDSKGSYFYNMELSKHRAYNVVNYLIDKGIDRDKIKSVGYGETMPVAKEVDRNGADLPEGRQKNRRIEFKIIGINDNN